VSALVVDTSSWILYLNQGGRADWIDEAMVEARVHLPPIVAAELLSGKLKPREREALMRMLERLPRCSADFAHWARVGELRAGLRAKGLHVSTPDAHVAQCALDLDGALLTEDAVFAHIARHRPLKLAAA
jgi:predicted nucleic acid-binding protein